MSLPETRLAQKWVDLRVSGNLQIEHHFVDPQPSSKGRSWGIVIEEMQVAYGTL